MIRSAVEAASLAAAVRAQVLALDKNIAAYDIRPMAQVRSESVAQRRFVLLLVAAFGVLALLMAAAGVYGVMALVVSERTAAWLFVSSTYSTPIPRTVISSAADRAMVHQRRSRVWNIEIHAEGRLVRAGAGEYGSGASRVSVSAGAVNWSISVGVMIALLSR